MRDILIVLSICVAAIILGAWLFFYGPATLTGAKEQQEQQQAAPITAEVVTEEEQPAEVSFTVIDTGDQAAEVDKRKNFAEYESGEFARLWKMAHGSDGKPLPKVDFSKDYVIAVFAGSKPSGGHAIAVDAVTDTKGGCTIDIKVTNPGSACVVTQALTSPYQMIVVPFSGRELTPSETAVETSC